MSGVPDNLPSLSPPRPLVLITGFLGAGKTTFLRGLLESLGEWHLEADVILNDYENAALDAETLQGKAAGLETLAAACACCDGMDSLLDLSVAAARSRHDMLAIELNGTADPLPLLESFTLLESRVRLRPRWQVCVVDSRYFGKRGPYGRLENLQLETASHFVIGHRGALSMAEREMLRGRIAAVNPKATETTPREMAEAVAQAVSRNQRLLVGLGEGRRRRGLPDPVRSRLAHEFTGCQILLPSTVNRAAMWSWLASLPPEVLRAKVLVSVDDEPELRRLFERVGAEVMGDPIRVPISDRVPSSAILIGPDLNPAGLLEIARKHFGESCRLPN